MGMDRGSPLYSPRSGGLKRDLIIPWMYAGYFREVIRKMPYILGFIPSSEQKRPFGTATLIELFAK